MSYTDLAQLAAQGRPPPGTVAPAAPQPQPDPRLSPEYLPPDPQRFASLEQPNRAANVGATAVDVHPPATDEDPLARGEEKAAAIAKDQQEEATPDTGFPTAPVGPIPYIGPPSARGPGSWGQDWPPLKMAMMYSDDSQFGDVPPVLNAYGDAVQSGRTLGQFGPPAVGQPASQASFLLSPLAAIADAFSHGKFSQNYSAAALRGLQIQMQQGVLKAQEANERHVQYLEYWNHLFAGIDARHPGMTEQEFRRQAEDYLNVWGDRAGINILHNYGPKGLQDYLNEQEANRLRFLAAITSIRKSTGMDKQIEAENAERQAMGLPPAAGGGGEGPFQFNLPGRDQPPPAQTPSADQEKPEQQPKTETDPTAAGFTQEDVDNFIAKQFGYKPEEMGGVLHEARERLAGRKGETSLRGGYTVDNMVARTQRFLGEQINSTALKPPPPGVDPDEWSAQKLNRIKAFSPEAGALLEGLKSLQIDPAAMTAAGGFKQHLVTLASQIWPQRADSPGWNQGMYHQFQTVWNKEDSKVSQGITGINRLSVDLPILEKAINNLPGGEDDPIPKNIWNQLMSEYGTGDPQYTALNEPLRTVVTDTVMVNNMGGRATVTSMKQMMQESPLHGSKRQLRTLARQVGGQLRLIKDSTITAYHRQTGLSDTPPSYDPAAGVIIDNFARQNPNTGKFPADAPSELKAIEPKTQNKRLKPDETYEPWSQQEYDRRRNYIDNLRKTNPSDPRIPAFLEELRLQE